MRALLLENGAHTSRVSAVVFRRSPSRKLTLGLRCRTGWRNLSTLPTRDAGNNTRDACAPPNPLLRHRHLRTGFLEGGDGAP
jgi:hypothetical protein